LLLPLLPLVVRIFLSDKLDADSNVHIFPGSISDDGGSRNSDSQGKVSLVAE
jgi:hypothetical protein